MGLTLTLADITEEEFRVLELIESRAPGAILGRRSWRSELPGTRDSQSVPPVIGFQGDTAHASTKGVAAGRDQMHERFLIPLLASIKIHDRQTETIGGAGY